MSLNVAVVCAHADDETLGCGGTILKHVAAGDRVSWVLFSSPTPPLFSAEFIARRKRDIGLVSDAYGFNQTFELGFPAAGLDNVEERALIDAVAGVFRTIAPDILYVVNRGDVHSDHRCVFDATWIAAKPLRGRFPARIMAFETPSSSNLAPPTAERAFLPQGYCDITPYLQGKINILKMYETEIMPFPGARSAEAMAALARYRGSSISVEAAEAFMIYRDIF